MDWHIAVAVLLLERFQFVEALFPYGGNSRLRLPTEAEGIEDADFVLRQRATLLPLPKVDHPTSQCEVCPVLEAEHCSARAPS